VSADLAAPDGATALAKQVHEIAGERLGILVANAGVAKAAAIEDHTVLPAISRRPFEGIIKIVAVPGGRIDKSVAVFFLIYWLKEEAFVTRLRSVFDQDSCRAIESPHFESCSEDATIGVNLVQTRHGMKAIEAVLSFR
jgi:thiamine pyrophosphokinase